MSLSRYGDTLNPSKIDVAFFEVLGRLKRSIPAFKSLIILILRLKAGFEP